MRKTGSGVRRSPPELYKIKGTILFREAQEVLLELTPRVKIKITARVASVASTFWAAALVGDEVL